MTIKINLIDTVLGNDPGFCRGRKPQDFEFTKTLIADQITIVSHNEILNFNHNLPKDLTYGIAIESKAIMPQLYEYMKILACTGKLQKHYKYIFTCYQELCDLFPDFFKWVPASGIWVQKDYSKAWPKAKGVSMVSSNKNWCFGHQFRLKLALELQKLGLADVYGSAVDKPIELVEEGLADYRFSFAIENDFAAGYFTEKLLNCFQTRTVPVYLGCTDLSGYFEMDGIVKFDVTQPLDKFVESLTPHLYRSKTLAIEDNWFLAQRFTSPEDYMFREYFSHLS